MSDRKLAALAAFAALAAIAAVIAAGPSAAQGPGASVGSPINGPAVSGLTTLPAGPYRTNMPMLNGPAPGGGSAPTDAQIQVFGSLAGAPASRPMAGPGPRRFGVPLGQPQQGQGRNGPPGGAPAPMIFRGVGR